MFVATLCERLVNVATPPTDDRVVVPCRVPLPALRLALTARLVLEHKLPNWSSTRITGCGAKATPALAVVAGCVKIVSLLGAAALTTTFEDVTGVRLPRPKHMFNVATTVL